MQIYYLFNLRNTTKTLIKQHNLCLFYQNIGNRIKIIKRQSSRAIPRLDTMDIDAPLLNSAKSDLLQIFNCSVAAVMPDAIIRAKVNVVDDKLIVNGKKYSMTDDVYLVGFGKAVAGMAYELAQLLGPRLKRGIVSAPYEPDAVSKVSCGFPDLYERREIQLENLQALKRSPVIELWEAAENNQPNDASLAATERIVELANDLGSSDTLIVLINGGGSTLLFQPQPPVSAERKRKLCSQLQVAGASIRELNSVRQRLSTVKGGGLARIAYPAKVLALVFSDIVGDPIEFIASGPTCPINFGDEENPLNEAVDVLKKYEFYEYLEDELRELFDTVTPEAKYMITDKGKFKHVQNILLGNNTTALQAAKETAKLLDLEPIILTNTVEGDVNDVSFAYTKLTRSICHILDNRYSNVQDYIAAILKKKIGTLNITEETLVKTFRTLKEILRKDKGVLLLAGGEPTVTVKGCGKGGRNQELALRFSLDWLMQIVKDPELAKYFVLFLSAGTDGQDGPTDATGAFGRPAIRPRMVKIRKKLIEQRRGTEIPEQIKKIEFTLKQAELMLPENVLENNDSYTFYTKFEKGKNLVKTGFTGTNVMDLHFIYIKKRDCECDIRLKDDIDSLEDCDFLFEEYKEVKTCGCTLPES